ncbi:cell wall shape-determining protein [Actibacterium mucosum KCTC 23349]|uniref:Peptidoglycan glycosyltransferase MrdB n=1 Tax=Actibacterium mucosum KCTC 23349 TaxID=1454373 RepID=A0A037ZNG8_9RHOB|nr:rod shape-determining protein RodA [Actibacterium mucosum]KAJ56376.1 cell wall shape-determining protein [Actibacterium mucosum KCTC 23349]
MSYLEHNLRTVPTGWRKVLHLHWGLILLLTAVASVGFLMLYSVAGGSMTPWAGTQMNRFAMGLGVMLCVAFVPIWFWRNIAAVAYVASLLLLVGVALFGVTNMGATRWIDLGFMEFQPSEAAKITVVMFLAAYYDWLDVTRVSRPLFVAIPVVLILIPAFMVLRQPDLGTAILLVIGGSIVMFAAGVHWAYFAVVIALGIGLVTAVFVARGTDYQFLQDYQYRRIDTFLDPAQDPQGAGYHITQSKIAMGSGGWSGRGYMQGTQSQLNFLPEKQTDFIFTVLAEELGFLGGVSLLLLYVLVVVFCIASALQNRDRFSSLLIIGIAGTFFLFFAINMSMVMGLAPVVGVPLPLVSYGGSSMLVLLGAFGLVQSAHVHRPRSRR